MPRVVVDCRLRLANSLTLSKVISLSACTALGLLATGGVNSLVVITDDEQILFTAVILLEYLIAGHESFGTDPAQKLITSRLLGSGPSAWACTEIQEFRNEYNSSPPT